MTTTDYVISAWSAVSPFGIGRKVYADAVNAGQVATVPVDKAQWQVPDERAGLVPGFDVQEVLGKKGTRTMNRVTGLAVSTVGQLIEDARPKQGADTALVLGTTTGSSHSIMDITRTSLTGERPFDVEPSRLPYCVLNCAAGQCAIWYGLTGPNTTIASGRPTGIAVFSYARRLLATGRAERVLCGAAEEYSAERAWIDFHSRGGTPSVLGEGCAMFLLEAADSATARPLAALLAVESAVCVDGDWRATVERCVRRALSAGGRQWQDVQAVSYSGADDAMGRAEREALAGIFGPEKLTPPVTELIGETHAASAAFQIATVLSSMDRAPQTEGELTIVTSIDSGGTVGAALLQSAGVR